jgi:AraC-like DNA-binding protein
MSLSIAAPPPTTPRLLSTRDVPEKLRLEYWQDLVCATYVGLDCVPPQDAGIYGDIEFSRIGTLGFSRVRSNGACVRRTAEKIRQDSEDDCLVLVQREGSGFLHQDGRVGTLQPGDFVLNDTTRPYELRFDGGPHDVYVLRLPRQPLAAYVSNIDELSALTVGRGTAAGGLLLTMMNTLEAEVAELHPASAQGICQAITSIVGAGLRSLPEANRRLPSNLAAYHLARIHAYVREHLRDPELSTTVVAAGVQLSPDHVCRLFRGEPMPLSRLIWQLRLDACRDDLADRRLAGRSISDIAFSCGFNDAAHFSRSFRERFGVSPRDWRATHGAAPRD